MILPGSAETVVELTIDEQAKKDQLDKANALFLEAFEDVSRLEKFEEKSRASIQLIEAAAQMHRSTEACVEEAVKMVEDASPQHSHMLVTSHIKTLLDHPAVQGEMRERLIVVMQGIPSIYTSALRASLLLREARAGRQLSAKEVNAFLEGGYSDSLTAIDVYTTLVKMSYLPDQTWPTEQIRKMAKQQIRFLAGERGVDGFSLDEFKKIGALAQADHDYRWLITTLKKHVSGGNKRDCGLYIARDKTIPFEWRVAAFDVVFPPNNVVLPEDVRRLPWSAERLLLAAELKKQPLPPLPDLEAVMMEEAPDSRPNIAFAAIQIFAAQGKDIAPEVERVKTLIPAMRNSRSQIAAYQTCMAVEVTNGFDVHETVLEACAAVKTLEDPSQRLLGACHLLLQMIALNLVGQETVKLLEWTQQELVRYPEHRDASRNAYDGTIASIFLKAKVRLAVGLYKNAQ